MFELNEKILMALLRSSVLMINDQCINVLMIQCVNVDKHNKSCNALDDSSK